MPPPHCPGLYVQVKHLHCFVELLKRPERAIGRSTQVRREQEIWLRLLLLLIQLLIRSSGPLKSGIAAAAAFGVPGIAPYDLRRTCAKLCRAAGGELEQIQLLLGHVSIQTTERYLGTKQDLVHAPNDGIKLRVAI